MDGWGVRVVGAEISFVMWAHPRLGRPVLHFTGPERSAASINGTWC